MARVAIPTSWTGALVRKRGPLLLYQWLWLLLCIAGALAAAAPRILTQPQPYEAQATTRFDLALYGGLYTAEGAPGGDFAIAITDATNTQQLKLAAQRELRFGRPDFRVEYLPVEPGVVAVRGIAPTAAEAQALANDAAAELTRQIRAAGGREVLRNLLGWELHVALRGEPPSTAFQSHLRDMIEYSAFPLSMPIEPISQRVQVENLPPEELNDLARALESRYDLWTFEISARDAQVDALCSTANLTVTGERNAALAACAATNPQVQAQLTARDQAIQRRQVVSTALQYLTINLDAAFAPDEAGAVQRIPTSEATPPQDMRLPLLALAAVFGLGFGGVSVAVDRSAGVMAKLRELWAYRELIRNLVLRDLRVRYKGSALGYLWTQLAPLCMMLVFWFVFSFFFRSDIAMFPIFLLVGLLPWNFCNEAVSGGTRSILDNSNLIKKVFFPREVLPLVAVLSSLLNFILSLPMLFVLMVIVQWLYAPLEGGFIFSHTIAYLPVPLLIQTVFLAGVAFFMAALAVFFRDIVHLIGILLQFWFFLTPVVYSLEALGADPRLAQAIRWFNPMASLIDFYREILYGGVVRVGQIPTPAFPALESVLRVLLTAVLVLAFGYWFFQRRSGSFGEEI